MEKVLNTRILLKYDSFTNWYNNNPVLKAGELAIATVPAGASNTGKATQLPATLLKVGDGTNTYRDLPFVSGIAANVYEWATSATKPEYTAAEIANLEAYVNNIISGTDGIQDTDTQYEIRPIAGENYKYQLLSKGKNDATFTTVVSTLDLSDIHTRLTTLENKIGNDSVADQIAANNAALANAGEDASAAGYVISKVSQSNGVISVSKKQLAASDIPELPQSKVEGLEDALTELDNSKQDNVVFDGTYNASSNKAATMSSITNAIGALDAAGATAGQGEIISKVSEADGIVSVEKRALVKADIPTIDQAQVDGLTAALAAKQDNLGFTGAYNAASNPVALKDYVDSVMADVNGAMHFRGAVSGANFAAAVAASSLTFEAGDVVLYGVEEYVYDGAEWHVLGNESIYALKDNVDSALEALEAKHDAEVAALQSDKQDNLAFDGTYNSTSNKVATVSTVNGAVAAAIADLDAAAVTAGEGEIISKVSEADGIVSVEKRSLVAADIPELAQSKITGLEAALAGKQGNLAFDGAYDASSNKVATVSTVTDAIGALDYDDSAVAKNFVTEVKQADGVIAVQRAAVADIALTGNVNDLVQTAGDVLVFNCGSSSVLV